MTTELDKGPDHYIMQAAHLSSQLATAEETATERKLTEFIVQTLPGQIPGHHTDGLQQPQLRHAGDPGYHSPSTPSRVAAQQGRGRAYRGGW